jgi:hypothetical protein
VFTFYCTNNGTAAFTFPVNRALKVIAVSADATAVESVLLKDASSGNTIATVTTVANATAWGVVDSTVAQLASTAVPEISPIAATTTAITVYCIAHTGQAVTTT